MRGMLRKPSSCKPCNGTCNATNSSSLYLSILVNTFSLPKDGSPTNLQPKCASSVSGISSID